MTSIDASLDHDELDAGLRPDSKDRMAIALAQASVDRCLAGEEGKSPGESTEDNANLAELSAALELLGEFGPGLFGAPDQTDGQPLRLGRFEILEERGRGGFGIVLRALDPLLQREVALKIPRPERLIAGQPPDDFVREAQVAARLEHPSIVRVYETRRLGPVWYIASAYCDGPTLAEWLESRTEPLTPQLAARLVAEVAEAIHYAHTRGVLHLDLKPENILLEQRAPDELPRPSVTDFGLAGRSDNRNNDSKPRIAGTLAYMAPEQRVGDAARIGTAADVYALGAILHDLLEPSPNPIRDTPAQTAAGESTPPARTPLASIPRNLDAICQKCLSEDPADRYDSARELAADLGRFLRGESVVARAAPWNERIRALVRRRPLVTTLCSILTTTVIIGLTAITLLWRQAESSLAGFRAEQVKHTETSRRMSHALLTLTRLTQEGRLQPRLAILEDEVDIQLLQGVYRDIQAWTDESGDQLPHGMALRAADHSLALVDGMDRLEDSRRNDAFLAGAAAWHTVIEESPDQPQWRRALALHLLTYAADDRAPRWLWWRKPESTDAHFDEAVAELALDHYALLLVEMAGKRIRLRRFDVAFAMLRAAITLLEERRQLLDPDHSRLQTTLVAYTALANVQKALSYHQLANETLDKGEALALTAPPVDECPPVLAVAVGELHKARAKFLTKQHDELAALAAYDVAKPYLARATELFPDQLGVRLSLVHLLERSAKLHAVRNQRSEVIACHRETHHWLNVALTRLPNQRNLLKHRGRSQALLAWQLLAEGSVDAQKYLEAAAYDFTVVGLSGQDATAEWMQAIRCYQALGRIYADQGLDVHAIDAYQRAIAMLEDLGPRRAKSAVYKECLNECRAALAQLAPSKSGDSVNVSGTD